MLRCELLLLWLVTLFLSFVSLAFLNLLSDALEGDILLAGLSSPPTSGTGPVVIELGEIRLSKFSDESMESLGDMDDSDGRLNILFVLCSVDIVAVVDLPVATENSISEGLLWSIREPTFGNDSACVATSHCNREATDGVSAKGSVSLWEI